MAEYLISDGGVTVRVTDRLEEWAENIVMQAALAVSRETVEALEPVAARARAEWYGPEGVTRETGRSGDIQVHTTIDANLQWVSITIGSTDVAMVKGRTGKARPRATAIHRPGALAQQTVELSKAEYWRRWRYNKDHGVETYDIWVAKKSYPERDIVAGRYYGKAPRDITGDGAFLLPKLVLNPARAALRGLNRKIGQRIAVNVMRGGANGG